MLFLSTTGKKVTTDDLLLSLKSLFLNVLVLISRRV